MPLNTSTKKNIAATSKTAEGVSELFVYLQGVLRAISDDWVDLAQDVYEKHPDEAECKECRQTRPLSPQEQHVRRASRDAARDLESFIAELDEVVTIFSTFDPDWVKAVKEVISE